MEPERASNEDMEALEEAPPANDERPFAMLFKVLCHRVLLHDCDFCLLGIQKPQVLDRPLRLHDLGSASRQPGYHAFPNLDVQSFFASGSNVDS